MKPYALIVLSNLSVKQFGNKEDWQFAIGTLRKADKRVIALRWSDAAGEYIQQQIEE